MTDVDEDVVSELTGRGSNLLIEELVAIVERRHEHAEAGVSRGTLRAYVDALDGEGSFDVDTEEFAAALDEYLIDAETWAGEDALYDVNGRVSAYPARWHAELGGSTNVAAYFEFIDEEVAGHGSQGSGGAGEGVPEEQLIDAIATIGRVERERANEALEAARADGSVAEEPDQHPDAGVQLADDHDHHSDGGGDRE
jgi:hypothetical protein